jgi:hypothetical protein
MKLTDTDVPGRRGLSILEGVCFVRLWLLLVEWLVSNTPLINVLGVSPSITVEKQKLRVYFV